MQQAIDMRRWQRRTFGTVWFTYFMYYFCRYNMPVVKTIMCRNFDWSAADFGKILTALTMMYAVGQFINGQLGDRFGTRKISTLGAFGSVLMNIAVFLCVLTAPGADFVRNHLLGLLIFFWGVNGFFQAMGWSPMVRAMAHWFPTQGRGKVMGALGTCYQFGAAFAQLLAIFLTGYCVQKWSGDWRMVFLVPAVLFGLTGVFFCLSIRNQPEDIGLQPLDETGSSAGDDAGKTDERPATSRRTIRENVVATVSNPCLWIVAGTFFLLDVNRYGFVNWLPAYVDAESVVGESLSVGFLKKAMKICIHPLAGSVGVIVCGWATDRFFGGRRAPVIATALFFLGVFSIVFTRVDPNNTAALVVIVALVGFFTYGAHILMVGHAAQDFGHKEGSAGAAGFIDCMGYIGASLAGWGAGKLIDVKDFGFTFVMAGVCALAGAALICILWKVGPEPRNEAVQELV